jgi:serine/threonine-protein kinase
VIRGVDAERWREAGALFHELVELDESSRSERLARLRDSDPALRVAVDALLQGDAIADAALPVPGFGLGSAAALVVRPDADRLPLEGQRVGRFRVLERVASGGMGVVYRAEDTQLHRTVALKFALPDRSLTEPARARMLREARAAGALDHPNLCPIYEVGESATGPFFAMPLYRGETLKERLARCRVVPLGEALAIIGQVAAGLECAHAAGVVHRDIKPGNVMLLPGGAVKLLDFGLARSPDVASLGSSRVVGTVHYMAPEQIRDEPVDGRADLWALGVILYEMLGGARPFGGETAAAVMRAILETEPVPLRLIDPAIPDAVDALARALLAAPDARVAASVSRSFAPAIPRGNSAR